MQAISERFFNWIFNVTPTDREWRRRMAVREAQLRKELKDLEGSYRPELEKVAKDARKALWAEYNGQCQPIQDELLSIELRRWAVDVPDQWDSSDGTGCLPIDEKAMNAMRRKIRDERLKVLAHQMIFVNIVVVILSLCVATLSLLVAFR